MQICLCGAFKYDTQSLELKISLCLGDVSNTHGQSFVPITGLWNRGREVRNMNMNRTNITACSVWGGFNNPRHGVIGVKGVPGASTDEIFPKS